MFGLNIDFMSEPFQGKISNHPKVSTQKSLLVTKDVKAILEKRVIKKMSAGSILVQPPVSKQKNLNLFKDALKEKF